MAIISKIKSNARGEILIPKKIRQYLGISQKITLSVVVHGKSLLIYPAEDQGLMNKKAYLATLVKTQGSWSEDKNTILNKKTLELLASKNRKLAW